MKFNYLGLNEQQVLESRQKYGANIVSTGEVETFWDKFFNNFKDPIIIILLVALIVVVLLSIFGFAPWYEGLGIAAAILMATLVATWSEYSSENEFQKLLEEASLIKIKVFRDNTLKEVPITELVTNDLVLLQSGDNVPGDGHLVDGHLSVNQAALTGESEAVKKTAISSENAEIDDKNKMFRASLIDDGEAVMKVTAVGEMTEYGKTLKELVNAESRLSPLQEKLSVLGRNISTFGYIGSSLIAIAFMYKKIFMDAGSFAIYFAQSFGTILSDFVTAFILAVIVIVMAVPEGLPMMIAIVLSINMRKLLAEKVLVRKLLGIETAGSLTVLFTDKTGTLTQGKLVAEKFLTGDLKTYPKIEELPQDLKQALIFAVRNNSGAVIDPSNSREEPKIVGADKTEQALLRFLDKYLLEKSDVDITEVILFNSSRKFSAMQVSGEQDLTLVKGAPEIILKNCTHYLNAQGQQVELTDQNALKEEMSALSQQAMRLLAIAVTKEPISSEQTLPESLCLVGIFGIRDGLRTTSQSAVKMTQDAGIQVVMITGDAKETAHAIAKDVGILTDKQNVVLTSTDLGQMSDEEVKKILPHLAVVARAYPTDKSRLVKLAKELNWVVGMTGDGVNDAPAIKNADVGFAMGSGTEMTKEAGDIVILDDNFASITQAILYGRTLFKSIRKFLVFQLTVSLSAVSLAFLGPFLGFELPLTMIQMLWINVIMDTLAALAFAGEPALRRYMLDKPIPKDTHLITPDMWSSILSMSTVTVIMSLTFLMYDPIYSLFIHEGMDKETQNLVFLTAFFGFFVFLLNFNRFNVRSDGFNLFENINENYYFMKITYVIFGLQILFTYIGGDIMRVVGLEPMDWVYLTLLAFLIIPADMIRKVIRNVWFGNPILTQANNKA
jgi:P-type Ca2+ transporter type 2C